MPYLIYVQVRGCIEFHGIFLFSSIEMMHFSLYLVNQPYLTDDAIVSKKSHYISIMHIRVNSGIEFLR